MTGIAHNRVEVDHAIESAACPDPFVDLLARCILRFRVVAGNVRAFTRHNGGANELDSASMCARNQLPVCISDILNAWRIGWIGKISVIVFYTWKADVINPFEQHNVSDAGQNECVGRSGRER